MTGSLCYFEFTPRAHYQGGDHGLFLGEVQHFDYRDGDAGGFLSGQFTSIPGSTPGPPGDPPANAPAPTCHHRRRGVNLMGIRTGQQRLDKLDAMTPEIYVKGETVTSKIAGRFIDRNPA
jgi:hypothetical protein